MTTRKFLTVGEMQRAGRAQEQVMRNYARNFNLSEEEQGELHMFFSPYRVPREMTLGEIKLAILLRSKWKTAVNCRDLNVGYRPRMTRSSFMKIVQQILKIAEHLAGRGL